MTMRCARNGVAVTREVAVELCELLGIDVPRLARPGADVLARLERGLPLPRTGHLLRARDGWVHPGPSTAWSAFTTMALSLGAMPAPGGLPDISSLPAEVLDAEAGVWRIPAVAVRTPPALPAEVASPVHGVDVHGARVVVLGTAWAAPLAGRVLHELGATVTRIDHPRRPDPFPLDEELASGQRRHALDLDDPRDRDTFATELAHADALVEGTTPRVLVNAGLDAGTRTEINPALSTVRLAAFAGEDRPGYGLGAECRAGWAARLDPPRLARTSVADPIAGLLLALGVARAVRAPGPREEIVTLEGAAGLLLERARSG